MSIQLRRTLAAVIFCGTAAAHAADYAGAFLEPGIGARGPGLGGAYAAVASGAEAAYWNPAGLVRTTGIQFSTAVLPLSLGRLQSSAAVAANLRGDLAFGCAWIHAGVDGIQGRTGSGLPTGRIEDAENAFAVAVALALTPEASVGAALQVFDHRLDVPGWRQAKATGHGLTLGLQYRLADWLRVAAGVRHLGAALEWKVERSTTQASSTTDDLPLTALGGAAIQPWAPLLLTVEVARSDDLQTSVGAEWTVNDLLTVRAGAQRLPGEESTPEALAAGLSLRPMRTEALVFHYAFVTDPIDAGDRAVFGLSMSF